VRVLSTPAVRACESFRTIHESVAASAALAVGQLSVIQAASVPPRVSSSPRLIFSQRLNRIRFDKLIEKRGQAFVFV
jgi:hypothetical protein